jgi:hypothetical protein
LKEVIFAKAVRIVKVLRLIERAQLRDLGLGKKILIKINAKDGLLTRFVMPRIKTS